MAKTFQKLARKEVRKLAAGERATEHGITFERLANGDGVFSVNIMVDGQRIHRVIGRESDGTTRTHAEEFIAKVRRDAREGRLNLPKGRKVALGFQDAAASILPVYRKKAAKRPRDERTTPENPPGALLWRHAPFKRQSL